MTTFTPPVISPVLQSVVDLKLEELVQGKEAFKRRYSRNPAVTDSATGSLASVSALLEDIKKLDPYLENDDDLPILARYVEQAKDDKSISRDKLLKFEQQLLRKLAMHEHRVDVSLLHMELLRETLSAQNSATSVTTKLEDTTLDDGFELVEGELEEVVERFEKNAFSTSQVSVEELEKYLSDMFEDEPAKQALQDVRNNIETYGNDVISGSAEVQLDDEAVVWSIRHLLENSFLSEEKRKILSGHLASPTAITELKSILTMKSVRHWNWRNAEKGLPVTARQNAEGKYCITIEEDIIDMLFLHTLAIGWSVSLKDYLSCVVSRHSVWSRNTKLSADELDKREYYLLGQRVTVNNPSPPQASVCTMCHGPPVPMVPAPPMVNVGPPPVICPPPPQPPSVWGAKPKSKRSNAFKVHGNLSDARFTNYRRSFFLSRLPTCTFGGCEPVLKPANETQAELLKHLATECRVRAALDGEVHCLSANIESFASSLPHETILTFLKFIGVPELFIEVFTRFLKAPLNMTALRGQSNQILTRTKGIPIAHGMELFLSELILFFLDFAVHQKTGGYIYRLRDKCYFVGTASQCTQTSDLLLTFAQKTGLGVKVSNSFDANPIGLLNFNISNTTPTALTITINTPKLEAYAHRVKKQLAACTTVLAWIRTWNTTVGTYAPHHFGPLANVFGKQHVDAIKRAYSTMHSLIFSGGNLTSFILQLLTTHMPSPLKNLPFALEPLIYLPHAYGGLGVKNAFIPLNLACSVAEDPDAEMRNYVSREDAFYRATADAFSAQSAATREEKLASIFSGNVERIAHVFRPEGGPHVFPSKPSFTRHRENIGYPYLNHRSAVPSLTRAYGTLLVEPVEHIAGSERVVDSARELAGRNGMKRFDRLRGEDSWVLQMYSEECFERYGGLEIWQPEGVPLELLRLVRGEEGDEEDWSSDSDFTEV